MTVLEVAIVAVIGDTVDVVGVDDGTVLVAFGTAVEVSACVLLRVKAGRDAFLSRRKTFIA